MGSISGAILVKQSMPIGDAIDQILAIANHVTEQQMKERQVLYLPM